MGTGATFWSGLHNCWFEFSLAYGAVWVAADAELEALPAGAAKDEAARHATARRAEVSFMLGIVELVGGCKRRSSEEFAKRMRGRAVECRCCLLRNEDTFYTCALLSVRSMHTVKE